MNSRTENDLLQRLEDTTATAERQAILRELWRVRRETDDAAQSLTQDAA